MSGRNTLLFGAALAAATAAIAVDHTFRPLPAPAASATVPPVGGAPCAAGSPCAAAPVPAAAPCAAASPCAAAPAEVQKLAPPPPPAKKLAPPPPPAPRPAGNG